MIRTWTHFAIKEKICSWHLIPRGKGRFSTPKPNALFVTLASYFKKHTFFLSIHTDAFPWACLQGTEIDLNPLFFFLYLQFFLNIYCVCLSKNKTKQTKKQRSLMGNVNTSTFFVTFLYYIKHFHRHASFKTEREKTRAVAGNPDLEA